MAKDNRRKHEPRHVRLYHSVTGSEAWRDLSGNAIKVWIALARLDGGTDNGRLFMSVRFGSEMTGLNKDTVDRALAELQQKGFIVAVEKGHFQVKGGPATTWRLTDRPAPAAKPSAPTHDYRNWKGGNKSRSQIFAATVPNFGTALETKAATVPKMGTTDVETPHVSVEASVPKNGTQVCYQGESVSEARSGQWKQANPAGGDFQVETTAADEVRSAVLSILNRSTPGAQTEIARKASIPGGTFSKFLSGRGLADHHLIALRSVVAEASAQSARGASRAA